MDLKVHKPERKSISITRKIENKELEVRLQNEILIRETIIKLKAKEEIK
jgi:hypothetical protein